MNELTFSTSKAAALTGLTHKAIREILATLPNDPGVEQIVAAFVTAVRVPASAPAASTELARDPNEPDMPRGVHSISALSQIFLLDRSTVIKRLRAAHVAPAFEKQKFKGFRLTDKGKGNLTVKQILEVSDDPKLTEARVRNQVAAAKLRELDYEERTNAVRKEIMSEVRDEATKLFKAMSTRLKQYWRENARRLRQCKTTADLQRTGETDQVLILIELKQGYPEMFNLD